MKRIFLAPVLVAGALALAACGSSGSSAKSGGGTPNSGGAPSSQSSASAASGSGSAAPGGLPTAPGSITVGSADFPENAILANIYGQAMAAKGVKVSYHLNIGERGIYIAALKKGEIGMVPEYSGSILDYLDTSATAKSPTDVYSALQIQAAKSGLEPTQYAAAQDADTITVTQQTATKYHLTSIADLKPVASKLTLGAPAQFKTRPDGVPGLKSVYGVTFGNFTSTAAGGAITVNALKNGSIDAADIFTTDPSIAANHFVSLTDPKNMFAAQNVTPLFLKKDLTQPMQAASDAVSAKLTTTELAALVAQVQNEKKDPKAVATAWLKTAGLAS